jgi:gamma-glutamyltranspeptidase/glutathione hydrolase
MPRGVIAAGHALTAEAGARMLREGGNAFDAAVAAVLASFAAESPLTGLGAGGFMMAHTAGGDNHLLDFFVEAGGRGLDPSDRAELVAAEVLFEETPQIFNIGPASCGVPGTGAGLWDIAQRFCSLPFPELAAPAIGYARDGVRVTAEQAYIFRVLEPIVTHYPETRELYAPGGRLLGEGDVFCFPDLADALERLAGDGPDAIYRGEVPTMVCDWVCRQGGTLSPEDFAAYRVVEREPVEAPYRGREVLTNPPPSSGGILIAYALHLLERAGEPRPLHDPDGLALLLEVMSETNRVRGRDFHARLHEDGFARAFLSGPHVQEGLTRVVAKLEEHGGARVEPPAASGPLGNTTHLCALDGEGNAASITCSNGTGSGVLVPGTGMHLNNMLGEEDLNPLGFHLHEPGTRVTSMMAPTVVLEDGEVELALGSAGSNRLRSAILQVVRHVVDYGMAVDEAVRRGRLHYEAGVLHVEPGFDARALDDLERRGYRVVRWRDVNLYFGGAQAVHRDTAARKLEGGGDPRRGGTFVLVE